MAGTGIWLSDSDLLQSAGQIWAQQQLQQVQGQIHTQMQAGQDWAQQQIDRLQQQAQQQVQALAQPAPPAPTPAPLAAPTPTPIAAAPMAPPVPIPTPTPGPTDLTQPGAQPGQLPSLPSATPAPMPTTPPSSAAPVPSTLQAGQDWAQQQIQNLLGPSAAPVPATAASAPPPGPAATPLPAGGLNPAQAPLGTSTQGLQTNPVAAPTPSPIPTPSAIPQATSATPQAQPSAPVGAIDTSSPQAFAQSFAPYAQAAAQKLGIDPKWVASMAASESNYGNAPGNELFGIKALPGQPGTSLQTHEGPYGGTTQNATFAAYNSPQDAVDAFVNLIQNHYPGAVGAQTLGDFVHGLKQGGYFTAAEDEYKNILQGIQGRIGGAVDAALQGGQNAVQNAVSGAQQAAQNVAQTGQTAVNTVAQGAQAIVARTSQFAMGLSSGDAMAFCGPAAAMAFAQTYGRNPTVDEAKQLAAQVGWNPATGMAGPSSEVSLLNKLGVDAHMTSGVDWNTVAQDASGGNPVIIDTPGHYFYVDGYNAQTGQFHLGSSATDLKAAKGQEWFTPDQIPSLGMGDPRAAIYADHPLAQQDGVAQVTPTQPANQPAASATQRQANIVQSAVQNVGSAPLYMGTMQPATDNGAPTGQALTDQLLSQAQNLGNQGASAVGNVFSGLGSTAQSALGGAQDIFGQTGALDVLGQGQHLLNALGGAQDLTGQLLGQGAQAVGQTAQNLPSYLQSLVSPAQDVLGGALNTALTGGQDLLTQAGSQAQDLLSNPVAQEVGGQILAPMLGRPAQGGSNQPANQLDALANALNPVATPDTTPLGSLAGALSGANVPVLSGAAGLAQPWLNQGGLLDAWMTPQVLANKYGTTDSSQYSPQDQQKLANSQANTMMAVGGMEVPDVPWMPGGEMPGQLPLKGFGQELPTGGAAPPAGGYLASAEAQPGQLPLGGFGQELPVGGPMPTASEANGPTGLRGALRGQQTLPGFPTGLGGPVTWGQRLRALQSGVISDPATLVKVGMNSAINPMWSFATRTAADLLGATPAGRLAGIEPAEALGRARGSLDGTLAGLSNVGDALAQGFSDVWTRPTSIAARATNPIDRIFGQVTQTPGALHAALQQAGQEVLTQMELGRAAGQEAAARGLTPGSQDFINEVANLMANPTQGVRDQATALAQRAVLRGDLGSLGQNFANLAGQGPGTPGYGQYSIGNALFPVFRVGWNALTQGVEKSPLGAMGTAFDVARATTPLGRIVGEGPYAGGAFQQPVSSAVAPLSERLTNNLFGTALTTWLASQALQGNITGDGPPDPGERQVLIDSGWQPHSVMLPGVGYVSYQGTPAEVPLGLAGDFADAAHNPLSPREQQQPVMQTVAERLFFYTVNSLASRTGLETMGQISDMLHGLATDAPTALRQFGTGLAANIAGSYVPESGLLHGVERATDPLLRQPPPGDVGAAIASRLPGAAENVPPRLDVLGRPLVNPQQGLAALIPTRLATGAPSPILDAYQRAGISPGAPPQTVNYGPYDQVFLTPEERQAWQQIHGQILQQSLAQTTADPKFQQSDPKSQAYTLNLVDQLATRVANMQILSTIQPDIQSGRVVPMPRPGSLTAPAQGYMPGVFNYDPFAAMLANQTGQQALQATMQQRQAERNALTQVLLGG